MGKKESSVHDRPPAHCHVVGSGKVGVAVVIAAVIAVAVGVVALIVVTAVAVAVVAVIAEIAEVEGAALTTIVPTTKVGTFTVS